MKTGTVYTETIIHSPPAAFAAEAPYQIAIISLDEGGRVTARIDGRVGVGDHVEFVGERNGIPFFRKSQ